MKMGSGPSAENSCFREWEGDRFGFSVSISGHYIILWARGDSEDAFGTYKLRGAGSAMFLNYDS